MTGSSPVELVVLRGRTSIELVKLGTLKVYPGASHGIHGAYQETLDKDILEFIAG